MSRPSKYRPEFGREGLELVRTSGEPTRMDVAPAVTAQSGLHRQPAERGMGCRRGQLLPGRYA